MPSSLKREAADAAPSPACHIVVSASYPILLEGLQHKFESEPGFHVVARCANGADTLRAVFRYRPHVLVLDTQIAASPAFEVLQHVGGICTDTRPVLLADRVSDQEMLDAMRLGVKGIILKSMSVDLLVRCVRKVHAGETWFERVSTGRAVDRLVSRRNGDGDPDVRLTHRQLEIARLVARGQSNKEIASRLTISEGTVKAHLHKLYERLGLRGRVDLVLYSQRQNV